MTSLAQAAEVGAALVAASGHNAGQHMRVDLRPDRVALSLQNRALDSVTSRTPASPTGSSDAVPG